MEQSSGMRTTGLTPLAYWVLGRCGRPVRRKMTRSSQARHWPRTRELHASGVCMLAPDHAGRHDPEMPPGVLHSLTGNRVTA